MAKKTSGEIKIKAGRDDITLRLSNGAIQDLEGYFDMSILEIAYAKLVGPKSRFSDIFVLYAAMTGRNISKHAERDEAAEEISSRIGLPRAIEAIHNCILSTLSPDIEGEQRGKR